MTAALQNFRESRAKASRNIGHPSADEQAFSGRFFSRGEGQPQRTPPWPPTFPPHAISGASQFFATSARYADLDTSETGHCPSLRFLCCLLFASCVWLRLAALRSLRLLFELAARWAWD
jgi:hypothetical protein